MLQRITRKLAGEHRAAKGLMARERKGDRHHSRFDFLHLVLRVLGIAPPRGLDECNRGAKRFLRPAALQNVVKVALIPVAILPCDFVLAASRGARSLEIKVVSVTLRNFTEKVSDKHLEPLPDDLSPAMSE
jgi:hypothetical protein